MKKILLLIVLSLFALGAFADNTSKDSSDADQNITMARTIKGYWKTIDDNTGKVRSIVHIYESNGALYGKIVKGFDKNPNRICTKCSGEQANKPMVGLTILWGFEKVSDRYWRHGSVLDPDNGSVYNCNLSLQDEGKELKVHGYIGISLFGRTQTWIRAKYKPYVVWDP